MLTLTSTTKNLSIDSKIVLFNLQIGEILSFILKDHNFDYLNECESPSSVLEIARKYLASSEIIKTRYKWRNPFSKVVSEFKNGEIQFNKKFINDKSTLPELAGNIAHECAHFFGFGHSYKWNPKRKYNSVYFFGYLVEYLFWCKENGISPNLTAFKLHIKEIK